MLVLWVHVLPSRPLLLYHTRYRAFATGHHWGLYLLVAAAAGQYLEASLLTCYPPFSLKPGGQTVSHGRKTGRACGLSVHWIQGLAQVPGTCISFPMALEMTSHSTKQSSPATACCKGVRRLLSGYV